ncbi:hypothetical protein [Bacillus sp. E214]|uniref:hypothetical protein n=1 Tax=Bacillus sp. E214 TaxID=2587156 RepID=UPI0011E00503|nr:hypothetical protein [Bacillus sp. E214]
MKKLKKVLAVSLSTGILAGCFALNVPGALAASNEVVKERANQGVIDLSNMEALQNDENITIEKITYEEMITRIADMRGISKQEAQKMNPRPTLSARTLSSPNEVISPLATENYHQIKVRQSVASSYKPALQLFVQVYTSGSFHQYNKIQDVGLDLRHNSLPSGKVKQYHGKIKAEIDGPQKIWWHLNGSFYDLGTTTVSGTVKASGAIWEGSGTVSRASNFYKYWNNTGNIY